MDSIVILPGILVIGSLLLPWVNLICFNSRQNSIRELREEVAALRDRLSGLGSLAETSFAP